MQTNTQSDARLARLNGREGAAAPHRQTSPSERTRTMPRETALRVG